MTFSVIFSKLNRVILIFLIFFHYLAIVLALESAMRNLTITCMILFGLMILMGCAKTGSVVDFVREGGLETKGLINLALASNGATVSVSQDNPDHPGSTLNNGITSSGAWDQGEGWETQYEGRFARGRYLTYGTEDPALSEERGLGESFDPGDPAWRGLRLDTSMGGSTSTALGWVIIELPEEKTVNRAIIHTIDSDKYPAEKFGVSDLSLQYWTTAANSWAGVERLGKNKDQAGNSIRDNKSGVITLRFEPVITTKMRLVVRWTNDSKRYARGYYTYASGTVRLLEIELYGYERSGLEEEKTSSVAAVQDANKIAEVEIVIDNYVDGYNRRDIGILMSSISPDYSGDSEAYDDLKERMESTFTKYGLTKLELKSVKVKLTESGATATSTYKAQYRESADDETPPIIASGDLIFELSNVAGNWKITKISPQ